MKTSAYDTSEFSMVKRSAALMMGLLVVVLAACADQRETVGSFYDLPLSAAEVEVVFYNPPPYHGSYSRLDPLWGDVPEDQRAIEELLKALSVATRVEGPRPSGISFLVIRNTDGSTTSITEAYECSDSPSGRRCPVVPDRWVITEADMALESEALRKWWKRMQEYMPAVARLTVNPPRYYVYQEQFLAINGNALLEYDTVELIVQPVEASRQQEETLLDQVQLDHGAFQWKGTLPPTIGPGKYVLTLAVAGHDMETIMSMSVLAPSEVACDEWGDPPYTSASGINTPAAGPSHRLPSSASEVEVIYFRPRHHSVTYDPLWGDLPRDRAAIDALLQALQAGKRVRGYVAFDLELDPAFLVIRHTDGRATSVREARFPDRWVIEEANVVLKSEALRRWWDRIEEYMPPVERLAVLGPDQVYPGQSFTIRGRGWHECDINATVEVILQPSEISRMEEVPLTPTGHFYRITTTPPGKLLDGSLLLGRAQLDHGAFDWEGRLPSTIEPGGYTIMVEIMGLGTWTGKQITVLQP